MTITNFLKCTKNGHPLQAVYVLREAEDRSISILPYWKIPILKDIYPGQQKVAAALNLINKTLDDLIAICKVLYKMLSQDLIVLF